MKKMALKSWCILTFIVGSVVFCLTGCEKAPVNNTIEAHWKLQKFIVNETQEIIKCEHLYLGISHEVSLFTEKNETDVGSSFAARTQFLNHESKIEFSDFKVREVTGDTKVDATKEQLLPFGIDNPHTTTFQVIKSSHHELIIESDYARLFMKRF